MPVVRSADTEARSPVEPPVLIDFGARATLIRQPFDEVDVQERRALGRYFISLPHPPGQGTLLQSVDQPHLFYSFGP